MLQFRNPGNSAVASVNYNVTVGDKLVKSGTAATGDELLPVPKELFQMG